MANQPPMFPTTAPETTPATEAPAARPLRWVVPMALFIVIIAGIAWVGQKLPNWRSRPVEPAPFEQGPVAQLRFVHPHNRGIYIALWEPMPEKKTAEKELYAREFEREALGQYDFPFQVNPELAAEIGVTTKSCDCSKLYVAVVSEVEWDEIYAAIRKEPGQEVKENPNWEWKSLEDTKEHGVALPAGARAVLRMSWTNKRAPGDSLNLGAQIWARVPNASRKQDYGLKIDAVSTRPLRSKKDRIDVGGVEQGKTSTAEFLVWSPTRDHAKFNFAQDDPLFELFEIAVKDFTPAECAGLQAQLRKEEINTRVRAAWTITVTVHEQKGKRQLDQGYFTRALQIDMPNIAAEDLPPLVVSGSVKSDFQIGAIDDRGKINLGSVPAKFGKKKTIILSAQTNIELDAGKIEHPAGLKVVLVETAKRKWSLTVEVPPNRFFGPITEDNLVILRTKADRAIRIPLMGHGVQ